MLKNLWYTGAPLDRVSHLRTDAAWMHARRKASDSRIVPVWRTKSLVHTEDDRALMPTMGEAAGLFEAARHWALLGVRDDIAYFGVDVSQVDDPYGLPGIGEDAAFEDLRQVGPTIPQDEGAILAQARGLMTWHLRHPFCAVCGSPTEVAQAGYQRNCANAACKAQHFPRTDPAVIMLVTKGQDMCLLGRTRNFRPGMYSTLAGFVEPGESLEEAVRREVFEEVGVRVGEVRYMASQPWPFPSSLMLGFHADAETTDLTVDPVEMEDARWLTREQMHNPREAGIGMPRGDSIAFRLIQAWLNPE